MQGDFVYEYFLPRPCRREPRLVFTCRGTVSATNCLVSTVGVTGGEQLEPILGLDHWFANFSFQLLPI